MKICQYLISSKLLNDISSDYKKEIPDMEHAPLQTYLLLGDAYRLINHYDDAKREYLNYLSKLSPEDTVSVLTVKNRISECHYAKVLMKSPVTATYVNMGQLINTGLANLNGCISGDGQTLVFTRKMKFYDAIFMCKRFGNEWSKPEEITTRLGSDGEFIPTSLSYDGSHMLLNSYGYLTGYDIYESSAIDGKWTKVKKLNYQVSTNYNDVDAVYAPDGQTIYFASNRESGLGGYDIYKSTKDELGNWSFVENLGPPVNTAMDERSPAIFDDGKVLVFSSNAEPNMGGYDYFYALKDSSAGKYKKVFNVGFPVNSSGNDLGIKFENKPGEGIIAKHDKNGFTDCDLFLVQFDKFSKFHLVPVSGNVTVNGNRFAFNKEYLISILDKNINDTVDVLKLDDNGNFSLNLYPGNFLLNIKGKDIVQNQEIVVPEDVENNNFLVKADLLIKNQQPVAEEVLNKPETKEVSALNEPETKETAKLNVPESKNIVELKLSDTCYFTDILFEFDQFRITETGNLKLIGLITKLKQCPVKRITITGYTDALGRKEYNDRLSNMRAKEVKSFFQNHGISNDILYTEAKGAQNYIAVNKNDDGTDNPKGRSFNRRVELIIDSECPRLIFMHKNNVPIELMFKID